jgi:hypothetical protein
VRGVTATWFVNASRVRVDWPVDVAAGVAQVDLYRLDRAPDDTYELLFLFARAGDTISGHRLAHAQAIESADPVPDPILPPASGTAGAGMDGAFRGAWDAGTVYRRGDTVEHGRSTWGAATAPTVGAEPGVDAVWVKLAGAAVGWDDLRVSLARGQTGASDPPAFAEFRTGIYAWSFAASGVDALFFDCQLPHSWLAGTGIRPHLHWSPGVSTNTGAVTWRLDYSWANIGDAFPAPTTLTAVDPADGVAYKQQIAGFGEIDGTGKRASSVLMCRLYRDGSDGADTFTAAAWGLSCDFHIQVSGAGSEDEYP